MRCGSSLRAAAFGTHSRGTKGAFYMSGYFEECMERKIVDVSGECSDVIKDYVAGGLHKKVA
jgi:hypothetical protein